MPIYEHPLNERVRTLLRLELLFRQAGHVLETQSNWGSRLFVDTIIDILDICSRGDIKNELIKEIERATANLDPLLQIPDIDHDRLRAILKALESLNTAMRKMSGQPGQSIRDNEFIGAIRQRSTFPGGTCDFDLPAYHHWLEKDDQERQQDQKQWFASLDTIRQVVELLLKLIRNSAAPADEQAQGGNFQQNLDTATPYQMLRILLPDGVPYYPEISGGKHRFSVRFLEASIHKRAEPYSQDVSFQLMCCRL